MNGRNLIYGIGSRNGDDQIGWVVVEKLRSRLPSNWCAKSGLVPIDLLNHLEGVESLHIVDACDSVEDAGTVHRIEWPKESMANSSVSTSHDFSLHMTLELAETVGILPKQVTIWGVVGKAFGPDDLQSLTEQDFNKVTDLICQGIRIEGNVGA